MMKSSKTYARLSQSEESILTWPNFEDDGAISKGGLGWTRKCAYILLITLGGITCAILGYVVHTATLQSSSTSTIELHCGNSSMEARELGCVFDLLTNNWMPEFCSDPKTDADYRKWVLDSGRQLGAWAYFHDEKAEHRITSEQELSDLVGKPVYTTTENHLAHCTLLARRMHRLVKGDIPAVAHNTFAHTMHCTSAVLRAIGLTEQPARAQIGSTFDVGIVSCLV